MGMFLDDTAMLVIVAPLYVPLVKILGFDPVWYGVLYTITCQIAYMTPPFGYNLFLMRAMAPQGNHPGGYLSIHHSLRPGHGAGPDPGHGVSADRICGCLTRYTDPSRTRLINNRPDSHPNYRGVQQ